jgi:4-hydroxy-tetrahydrodipicolinate synthase
VIAYRPEGLIAASVTPFADDASLDEGRLRTHLDYLIAAGVDGILVIGGSGEYVNLTPQERARVIDVSAKHIARRVPMIVGALGPSTREAVEIGCLAAQAGAVAVLAPPPYYIKPTLDGTVVHFQDLVRETGLPVIAYNNPGRTGVSLGVDELMAIARVEGVVGVKESDRDVSSIAMKIIRLGSRLSILSGDDDLGFATLLSGSPGAIWSTPNLAPRLCGELFHACREGNLGTALRAFERLMKLIWVRRAIPNHPGPLKECMALAGRSVGRARAPLAPMTSAERMLVFGALRESEPIE